MNIPQPHFPPLDPVPAGQGAEREYPPLIERSEELLTADEVAFYTRVSRRRVLDWAREGRPICAVKVGKDWRWSTDGVRLLLGLPTRAEFTARPDGGAE